MLVVITSSDESFSPEILSIPIILNKGIMYSMILEILKPELLLAFTLQKVK
jgi:hypothetical protein